MRHEAFLDALDDARIVAAIREAESRCRAEIRVHVTDEPVADARPPARATFETLGMTQTAERNGVLIFVAPVTQRFAVLGDSGIHGAPAGLLVGGGRDDAAAFRAGRFTDGVVRACPRWGRSSRGSSRARAGDTDRNELPDAVSRD